MVTGVTHELSNPLTSILGYSQRLLLRNDLAARTEEVRQIYQEAERASTILRQLLLTARETRPERKLISLNQIVLHVMELQRFGLAADKTRVELDLEPVLPFVSADPGQMEQVLLNLIVNARQALEQEGRDGTIRLRTARAGENRVLLEVRDDGPGIPQAILSRMFDPFFTTKPAGVGTGLGLAIVLSVVREHGGQVNVSSPPGGGAIFSIELPATSETAIDSNQRSTQAREEPALSASSRLPVGLRCNRRRRPPDENVRLGWRGPCRLCGAQTGLSVGGARPRRAPAAQSATSPASPPFSGSFWARRERKRRPRTARRILALCSGTN
jgi:Histidine kinase-, DNA gyrase B-, and HSP90-like ATPase/His Kinase A (phospho-acceptor) domain